MGIAVSGASPGDEAQVKLEMPPGDVQGRAGVALTLVSLLGQCVPPQLSREMLSWAGCGPVLCAPR